MPRKSNMSSTPDDSQFVDAVRSSAHQIWQAGLGAFAMAQEEGGKLFEKLVRQGSDLQGVAQRLAGDSISSARETAVKMTTDAGKQAADAWNLLEQGFEERVARSLDKLGVSTNDDMRELTRCIEDLSKSVNMLSGKKRSATKALMLPEKSASKTGSVRSVTRAVAKPAPKATAKNKAMKAVAKPAQKKTAKPSMSRSV